MSTEEKTATFDMSAFRELAGGFAGELVGPFEKTALAKEKQEGSRMEPRTVASSRLGAGRSQVQILSPRSHESPAPAGLSALRAFPA